MSAQPLAVAPAATRRDARRLIFIRKRWTGAAGWSDAIQQFYEGAAALFSEATCLEVSVNGVGALHSANQELLRVATGKEDLRDLVVLINHSICWWAVCPVLRKLKRRGATICLCMHEHEHILGMSFALKHLWNIRPKEILRYSRLFHGIPAKLSTRVLVLTDAQASVLGIPDAIRTSYLPVSGAIFRAHRDQRPGASAGAVVLFAHDPSRFDKGHRFVASVQSLTQHKMAFVYGRDTNLPFDRVYEKYWDCDVLFLPSDWESYSLVFIEALACNKFVVTNTRVGAVRLLLGKYAVDELESFGLFVSDHSGVAYARCLDRAVARVEQRASPTTRSLFEEFGFDAVRLPAQLL
jgi:Glycosyl transferases group 1